MRRPARRCRQRRAACAHCRPAQHAFAVRTNHSAAFLTPSSSANPSRRFAFALRSFPAAPSAHHSPSAAPFSSANPSRRFAFALRSFSNAPSRSPAQHAFAVRTNHSAAFPLPAPAHSRPHPRTHRIVSHSPFAAFPTRHCPHQSQRRIPHAHPRISPLSSANPSRRFAFALRSFSNAPPSAPITAPHSSRPPSAAPSSSANPSHRFAFALRSFPNAPQPTPTRLRRPRPHPQSPSFSAHLHAAFRGSIRRAHLPTPKTENRAETFIPARNRSVCRLRTPAPGRRTGRATCARSAADRPPD